MAASQLSNSSSVQERLPPECFLNLADDDEGLLEDIIQVNALYFEKNAPINSLSDSSESDDESGDGSEVEYPPVSDSDVLDLTSEDRKWMHTVQEFQQKGCGCKSLHNGTPCSEIIGMDILEAARLNMADLSREEMDLVILGQLQQYRVTRVSTLKTSGHSQVKERQRASMRLYFGGVQVCQATYLFVNDIGIKRFKNLCHHFDKFGVMSRSHGNSHRVPVHAITPSEEKRVVDFIQNYSEVHAVPLPGRLPKHKDFKVMALPSDTTKLQIHAEYVKASQMDGSRAVSLSTFRTLWLKYVPHITVMRPATDLCSVCQRNNNLIIRSSNLLEDQKSELLKKQEEHLDKARECRQYYRDQCAEACGRFSDVRKPTHVSFDYAQNVLYPYHAQQVGPMFFKVPRKCHLFGVCCEGTPQQVNYVIDESEFCGKGANATISYLHHFLNHHAPSTSNIQLHCDNCAGQNKNNFMMMYLVWNTVKQNIHKVELSCMLTGHTRFGPDWYFGLFKQKFRKSSISCIQDIGKTFRKSSCYQSVQYIYDGDIRVVPAFDWKSSFQGLFTPIPHISRYHHFRFSADHPGKAFVREFPSSVEEVFRMVPKNKLESLKGVVPPEIPCKGLSSERQWYLFDNIREHCSEEWRDIVCPEPSEPRHKKHAVSKQNEH